MEAKRPALCRDEGGGKHRVQRAIGGTAESRSGSMPASPEEQLRALREQVRRLFVLCRIGQVLQREDKSPRESLQKVVRLVASVWPRSEFKEVRIRFGEYDAFTAGFTETQEMQRVAFVTKNGQRGTVEVACSKRHAPDNQDCLHEDGKSLLAAVAQSLSAFFNAQEARWALIHQSEIMDQIHDAVVSTDLDGNVLTWNAGAERLFGFSGAEMMGRSISKVYDPRQHAFLQDQVIAPLKEKGEHEVEAWMRRKSGDTFCAHLRLSLLRDSRGKATRMVGYSMDITDRKRAEQALENRSRLHSALARLGQAALAGLAIPALLAQAVVIAGEALGVEYCKVLELLPNGRRLRLRAGSGWKAGLVGRATVGANRDSQAGYTLLSSAPIVVTDLHTDQRFRSSPLLRSHGVVSGMNVIIGSQARPFGILGAHTTRRREFSEDEICFLQGVANVIAQALGREEARVALEDRERSFRMLTENLPGVVYQLSVGKRPPIRFFSKAAEAILGFAAQELGPGKYSPVESVMAPQDRQRFQRVLRQAISEHKPFSVEYRVRQRGGRIRVMLDQGTPIMNPAGKLASIDGVVLDQTDLRAAEEGLNRERAFREAIEKSVPAGIAAVDLVGRQIYVNPFFCEMLGWREGELLGRKPPFVYWPPEERKRIQKHFRATLAGNTVKRPFEVRFQRRNGKRFWVSFIDAPLISAQKAQLGHAAAIFDITERKQLESQVLEISEREKRRVGQDLHDSLSQQLRGIAYLCHALELNLADESSTHAGDARRIALLTQEAIVQASNLARGLVSFDQKADGLMSGLNALAAQVGRVYGVSCRFHCPRRVLIPDLSRAVHLFRIAQEAVENAIRHGKPSQITIRLARRRQQIELTVGDNGGGMPAPPVRAAGMGLKIMSYRANTIGASLSLERNNGGMLVRCALPIQPPPSS